MKKKSNLAIIIFPYMFIHPKEGVDVAGLKLLPSFKDNVESEKTEIKEQLLNIAKLFRLSHLDNIYQWSYIVTKIASEKQWKNIKNNLDLFINMLRYSQLKDLRENAKYQQFDYFLFELTAHQLENDREYGYYNGLLNGLSNYNFHTRDGKCTNPYIPRDDTNTKIITKDEIDSNDYYQLIFDHPNLLFKNGEDRKIARAIEWFNRSFSHYGRGIDLSEAILNVHTALEALLRPVDEDRGVKAQIKSAMVNLLGNSVEINKWLDKFWKLRNSIVHGDIEVDSLLYIHPDSIKKVGHRHHLTLARKVFTRCVDAIIKVRSEFPLLGLEEEFVSNELRVKIALKILKTPLKKLDLYYKSDVFGTISSLRNDDLSSSKVDTVKLGARIMELAKIEIIKNVTTVDTQPLQDLFDKILSWKLADFGDLAILYSELEKLYSPIYFEEANNINSLKLRGAAYNFMSYATWRLLTF